MLEEQSIYWNDDLEFVIAMVSKTFKKFTESSDSEQALMPLFKMKKIVSFWLIWFRKTIINHNELRDLVDVHSSNWEIDRDCFC